MQGTFLAFGGDCTLMPPIITEQARRVLEERYFDKDKDGNLLEDWEGLCRRVAKAIAQEETKYDSSASYWEGVFFENIYYMNFLPNTPTLFNAGSRGKLGLLSACFVQIPDDSIDSIMQHAWWSAKLFQAGAGVGYNFSNLREEGAYVRSSGRQSSGAISFMKNIFNSVGEVVRQGGRRRAAMMGLLNDDHPEIEKFITFKNNEDALVNFNISVFASDRFMRAVENNDVWHLKSRVDGSIVKTVSARELMLQLAENNWSMAEPGMIWRDTINRYNPLMKSGYEIHCVNPCGEATLLNAENCCLGSINLKNHVSGGDVNWGMLEKTVRMAVRFLDDVVDANRHVHEVFERASKMTRRIGIGVTGFADVLIMLNITYGSDSSFEFAKELASFMNDCATDESKRLAKERGCYPLWEKSLHKYMGLPLRNVSLFAIAPEGSRSIISNTSPSIEPNFGRIIARTSKGIGDGVFMHPLAESPSFITTYEVPLEKHIKMQSVWQNALNRNMVAQAISKTNNAPRNISPDEIMEAYLEAWRLGCKGLTMYRDGSRDAVYYEARDGEIRDEHGRIVPTCNTGSCDVGMIKTAVTDE